jgi:hypothetical protein
MDACIDGCTVSMYVGIDRRARHYHVILIVRDIRLYVHRRRRAVKDYLVVHGQPGLRGSQQLEGVPTTDLQVVE